MQCPKECQLLGKRFFSSHLACGFPRSNWYAIVDAVGTNSQCSVVGQCPARTQIWIQIPLYHENLLGDGSNQPHTEHFPHIKNPTGVTIN